jgi:hypothetical protein
MGTICKRRNKEEERKKRQNGRKDLTLTGLLMVNRPILIRSATKRELEGIIAFILISWRSGSPLLNTDPDKSLFRERASHAVRLFLSHFAVILATQIWTGLPPARNRSRAVVRGVCAIRLLRTAGGESRLMTRLTIGSKFAEACVGPAI